MALNTEDLGHGITCIDTGYTRTRMTACYLLQQGGYAAFIETGVNNNVAGLLELLDERNINRDQVTHIMPTHVHLDHAGGVGALMQALPAAQLVVHPRGARHMIDPGKLIAGASAVYGEEKFRSMYGDLLPVDPGRVLEAEDGFVLDFHGRPLEFLDTPGHARHHYCIYDALSNGVFTGDTMGLSYPELNRNSLFALATTTPVQFDPVALHASVDRIAAKQPGRLYLTHFGMITQVDELVKQLHGDIERYVDITNDCNTSENADCIASGIRRYLLDRLSVLDSSIPPDLADTILRDDIDLNAQGLAFWTQHR